jgi:hypothetical protein
MDCPGYSWFLPEGSGGLDHPPPGLALRLPGDRHHGLPRPEPDPRPGRGVRDPERRIPDPPANSASTSARRRLHLRSRSSRRATTGASSRSTSARVTRAPRRHASGDATSGRGWSDTPSTARASRPRGRRAGAVGHKGPRATVPLRPGHSESTGIGTAGHQRTPRATRRAAASEATRSSSATASTRRRSSSGSSSASYAVAASICSRQRQVRFLGPPAKGLPG